MHGWIVAAQHGEELALAKLLTVCHPRLRARAEARLAPALRARLDPDDVLQEVYCDVPRQIRHFEDQGSGSFLSWLYAILDHKLIDAQRAAHGQRRDVGREITLAGPTSDSCWNLLDEVYAQSGTPSRVARRQEALGALLASLSDLTDVQREVIRLRYLEGVSVAEAARRLSKSEEAIVALTQRGLAALRGAVERRGDFTHGG